MIAVQETAPFGTGKAGDIPWRNLIGEESSRESYNGRRQTPLEGRHPCRALKPNGNTWRRYTNGICQVNTRAGKGLVLDEFCNTYSHL